MMILDATTEGLEVFYDGKLRNLCGHPDNVVNWVIEVVCDKLTNCECEDDIYYYNTFIYRDETWIQYSIPFLDTTNFGRLYCKLFDDIGFKYEKLEVKRVNL